MDEEVGRSDRTQATIAAWAERCAAHGVPTDRIYGDAATYLINAIETALRRNGHTPHLGRAARSWGAGFGAPGDVVAALTCLREVLGAQASSAPGPLLPILDQVMVQAVDAASGRLQTAARTDPLTGCPNRRALSDDLRRATANARDTGLDLAVVAVDLDGLKQINDTHGHAAGDGALLGLVATFRACLREADTLYRVGGDEFVVLAPFTDAAGASELMQRVERRGGPAFSWGVASLAGGQLAPGDDPHLLIQAADADLYARRRAKRRQRAIDRHRRRLLAAATVAASVAATVAASVELGGGHPARLPQATDAAPIVPPGGSSSLAPATAAEPVGSTVGASVPPFASVVGLSAPTGGVVTTTLVAPMGALGSKPVLIPARLGSSRRVDLADVLRVRPARPGSGPGGGPPPSPRPSPAAPHPGPPGHRRPSAPSPGASPPLPTPAPPGPHPAGPPGSPAPPGLGIGGQHLAPPAPPESPGRAAGADARRAGRAGGQPSPEPSPAPGPASATPALP